MGYGEEYWIAFNEWFRRKSDDHKHRYAVDYPEPPGWEGFYQRKGVTRVQLDEGSLARLDAAMGEFRERAQVVSVTCDQCEQLINIEPVGPEAWSVDCSCGKFTTALRGL